MPTRHAPAIPPHLTPMDVIHFTFANYVRLGGVALSSSAQSVDVTTPLGVALRTAGRNAESVPFQISQNQDRPGVIISSSWNRCLVFDGSDQSVMANATTGAEIYGRVTFDAGVYTVSFVHRGNAGAEVAATIGPLAAIAIEIPYLFRGHELSAYAGLFVTERNVSQDPANGVSTKQVRDIVDNAIALEHPDDTGSNFPTTASVGDRWYLVNHPAGLVDGWYFRATSGWQLNN